MINDDEPIVLLDNNGKPTGETLPKLEAHHANTPLHLAFSCYLFDEDDKLLVTRRALSKKVWPGVWTNSFCGHPMPGESMKSAIERRAQFELGAHVSNITCPLPDYRYTTPPFNGIIENECCPVYMAKIASGLSPNPAEVGEFEWISVGEYVRRIEASPASFSYWCKDQLAYLFAAGSPYFMKL